MANRTGDRKWFELTKTVEAATKEDFRELKGKEIYPNVDFYSPSVAQPKPELYRPDADYVGFYCGPQACPYIPIEERSK